MTKKFDSEKIDLIKKLRKNGVSQKEIANKFSVSQSFISRIEHRKVYKKENNRPFIIKKRLTQSDVDKMFELRKSGLSKHETSNRLSIKVDVIRRIEAGLSYKDFAAKHFPLTYDPASIQEPLFKPKNRKLDKKEIDEILFLRKKGFSQIEVANKLGIHQTMISRIESGKMYIDLIDEPLSNQYKKRKNKLSKDKVIKILDLRKEGLSQKEIAVQFDISPNTVSAIENKRIWKKISI